MDTAHDTEVNASHVLHETAAGHQRRRRRRRDQIRRLRVGATDAETDVDVERGRDRGRFRAVPARAVRRADTNERGVPGRDAGHRTAGGYGRTRARGRVLAPAARRPATAAATDRTADHG